MPETDSSTKTDGSTKIVDFTKIAVGTLANLGGQPIDYAKSLIFDRAGLSLDASQRVSLVYTHASAQGKVVPRLSDPFPPEKLPEDQKLESAADYLALIDATAPIFVATPTEIAQAQKEADHAEAAAKLSETSAEAAAQEAAALARQSGATGQAAENGGDGAV